MPLLAFVTWFDCDFSACHSKVRFSTGPKSRYTHWKQTVFYISDVIAAKAGEKITGRLICQPNKKNKRDLDMQLIVDVSSGQYDIIPTQPLLSSQSQTHLPFFCASSLMANCQRSILI